MYLGVLGIWRDLRFRAKLWNKNLELPWTGQRSSEGSVCPRVTPADVSGQFITPGLGLKGSVQIPSSPLTGLFHLSLHREQQSSCSKGHFLTCLTVKRPSVLLINSSWEKTPNQPPKTLGGVFWSVQWSLIEYGAHLLTNYNSLRSIWCAMEKAEQLVLPTI